MKVIYNIPLNAGCIKYSSRWNNVIIILLLQIGYSCITNAGNINMNACINYE